VYVSYVRSTKGRRICRKQICVYRQPFAVYCTPASLGPTRTRFGITCASDAECTRGQLTGIDDEEMVSRTSNENEWWTGNTECKSGQLSPMPRVTGVRGRAIICRQLRDQHKAFDHFGPYLCHDCQQALSAKAQGWRRQAVAEVETKDANAMTSKLETRNEASCRCRSLARRAYRVSDNGRMNIYG